MRPLSILALVASLITACGGGGNRASADLRTSHSWLVGDWAGTVGSLPAFLRIESPTAEDPSRSDANIVVVDPGPVHTTHFGTVRASGDAVWFRSDTLTADWKVEGQALRTVREFGPDFPTRTSVLVMIEQYTDPSFVLQIVTRYGER